jgi:hypothetical protein
MLHRDLPVLDGLQNSHQLRQRRRLEFAYCHPFRTAPSGCVIQGRPRLFLGPVRTVTVVFNSADHKQLLSQPRQAFYLQPYGLLDVLPAFYPGRNVPDVSFNADPDTGYVIYYTSSATGFGLFHCYGGTSFVDQQLNGVTALLRQDLRTRVGFLNPALYTLAQTGQAYFGPRAPLHAIAYGDNWFYYGSNGYNPEAGLGTMDVTNFAAVLRYQH